MNYEKALKKLQDIVNELETEAVSIDDLTDKIKDATELIQLCKKKLRKVEKEVSNLIEDA